MSRAVVPEFVFQETDQPEPEAIRKVCGLGSAHWLVIVGLLLGAGSTRSGLLL